MPTTLTTRTYSLYEVLYRRAGKKRSFIANSKKQANNFRSILKRNRRKFLGVRPVKLVEVTR